MARDLEGVDCDRRLLDREDAARAEGRHAAGARLALMRGIGGDDAGAVGVGVVKGVVDGHGRHMPVGERVLEERAQQFGHAEKRRQGQRDHAAGGVGAGQPLDIDVMGRLLVEPYPVQCRALPFLASLLIGFEGDGRDSARDVPDL